MTSSDSLRRTLFLAGDVMTGRGVDQIFSTSSAPKLFERYVDDARQYVELAEDAHGPVSTPVDPSYVWGDGLELLDQIEPAASIINLETSVTVSDDYWEAKGIHYRMHPDNVESLTSADIDVCALANNHAMDFGRKGLIETLEVLNAAGIETIGAGTTLDKAARPATLALDEKTKLVALGLATPSSGIPHDWMATSTRPGLFVQDDLSKNAADEIVATIDDYKNDGDIAVVSIHWGSNWGWDIPAIQTGFARRLAEGGVDVLHGHSSHHVRPVESYAGNLIMYGCGDLITDYEGIGGHEKWRGDLGAMYLADVSPDPDVAARLRLAPMQMKQMRLTRPPEADRRRLLEILNRIGAPFQSRFEETEDGLLEMIDSTRQLADR